MINPDLLMHLSLDRRHSIACQHVAEALEWASRLLRDDEETHELLLRHVQTWRRSADDDPDPDPGRDAPAPRHLRVHPGGGEGGEGTPPTLSAVAAPPQATCSRSGSHG